MPIYQFRNKNTNEIIEKMMKIAELNTFKSENPDLEILIGSSIVADPTRLMDGAFLKGDATFQKYIIGRMKEAIPGNTLSDRKFQIPKEY